MEQQPKTKKLVGFALMSPAERAAAGKKGGERTRDERGTEHYAASGRKGGESCHARNGSPFYREISKLGVVASIAARQRNKEQKANEADKGE